MARSVSTRDARTPRSRCHPLSASLVPQDQVKPPASPDVRPRSPQVREDVGVVAPSVFESIGQHGEAVGIEGAGGRASALISTQGYPDDRRWLPGTLNERTSEGGGEDVAEA